MDYLLDNPGRPAAPRQRRAQAQPQQATPPPTYAPQPRPQAAPTQSQPIMFDQPRQRGANPTIIKVLGVGGGGSNAVTHMFRQNIVGVDFAIANTDAQALDLSPVPTKIHLGPSLTAGRGAGSKPEVGREAGEESIHEIHDFLDGDCQMLFVTAGMGGGTGTGAAPIVARVAQDMGILTVGIVTLPFAFEGRTRIRNGIEGLMELKKHVDALVVVSNDKLRLIHADMPMRNAFAQADNVLTTAARGIAEIITRAGYVNVDFQDVDTVLRDSGVAIMGIGYAAGEGRAQSAVDQALSSPLLEDNNISGAQNILLNICSGTTDVTMDEIDQITQFVQDEAGQEANLIWGTCFDESLEDGVSVTVIATGFQDSAIQAISGTKTQQKQVVDLKAPQPKRPAAPQQPPMQDPRTSNQVSFDSLHPRVDQYNRSVEYRREVARDLHQRNTPPAQQPGFDPNYGYHRPAASYPGEPVPPSDPNDLASLEREPAYLRMRRQRQQQHSQQPPAAQPSRTVVDQNGEPRLGAENPWLYDKAD